MSSEAIPGGQCGERALPAVDTWLSDCRILLVHSDALVGVLVQRALSLLVDEVVVVARDAIDFDETFDNKFNLAIVDMSADSQSDHQALVRMLRKLKDADIAMVALVDDEDLATAGLAAGFDSRLQVNFPLDLSDLVARIVEVMHVDDLNRIRSPGETQQRMTA